MHGLDRRAVVLGAGSALASARALAALPAWAAAGDDPALRNIVDSELRSAADKARDVYRHPYASLIFWGLKPGMTVIDVDPGAGWWTDILAPYLARTHGRYIAAVADLNDPKVSDEGRKARAGFEAKYVGDPKLKDAVSVVGFGRVSGALAPSGSVDLVLVSRETHNWVRPPGFMQKALGDFHAALKPAGILAIEDHRAADGADPAKGDGYISEAYMIGQAKQAGFALAARSEVNANPKDTRDYPFGVWTLPPTRRSAPFGQPDNPTFDHAKYDAIGESDRMTLKFVKT